MTYHYPDLDGAFDWLKVLSHVARPIRSTTHLWGVIRHQYGISALVPGLISWEENCGGIAKCQLFSQSLSRLKN